MSYEPTNWRSCDVVTSARLNKLEQGVADAGGVFEVVATKNTELKGYLCNASYNDVKSAVDSGCVVYLSMEDELNPGGEYEAAYTYKYFLTYLQTTEPKGEAVLEDGNAYEVGFFNDNVFQMADPDEQLFKAY